MSYCFLTLGVESGISFWLIDPAQQDQWHRIFFPWLSLVTLLCSLVYFVLFITIISLDGESQRLFFLIYPDEPDCLWLDVSLGNKQGWVNRFIYTTVSNYSAHFSNKNGNKPKGSQKQISWTSNQAIHRWKYMQWLNTEPENNLINCLQVKIWSPCFSVSWKGTFNFKRKYGV